MQKNLPLNMELGFFEGPRICGKYAARQWDAIPEIRKDLLQSRHKLRDNPYRFLSTLQLLTLLLFAVHSS